MTQKNKLQLEQSGFADKVDISRQTLLEIEKKKRPMPWDTFVALITVFCENNGTNDLLDHFRIYFIGVK